MAVTRPTVIDRVANSGASNCTTSDAGNLTTFRPFNSTTPSSIIVGNESILLVTLLGYTVLPNPFYLNTISLLLLLLFKISYLFIVLRLTTGVLWSLTCLVFL
jgi:hypothetical protein